MNTPVYGPGFRRMADRLGPSKMEALRQDVLRGQRAALAEVATRHVTSDPAADRATYSDYPPPAKRRRGRKE